MHAKEDVIDRREVALIKAVEEAVEARYGGGGKGAADDDDTL